MAHELARQKNGLKTMAYREGTETPWHGDDCGRITAGMTLDQMREVSGLNYDILELPSLYEFGGKMMEAPNRKMLVRSDDGSYLSQMSENKYDVRQPKDIVEFFRDLCDFGGFEIETLGALFDGKKVWCLAKRKGGKAATGKMGKDIIKPYIMLADSYDGTLATVARMTSVRVVCNNTLRFSEKDKATQVKIGHNQKFNADKVKAQLGEIDRAFADYMESMKNFGSVQMSNDFRERFFLKLIGKTSPDAVKENKHFFGKTAGEGSAWLRAKIDRDLLTTNSANTVAKLMKLAEPGNSPGADYSPNTLYNALQTVTYFVDHEKQANDGGRWQSASFGSGAVLKDSALELATSIAS
jgi:phage/plasmid-like protein (TIGR03299 family)